MFFPEGFLREFGLCVFGNEFLCWYCCECDWCVNGWDSFSGVFGTLGLISSAFRDSKLLRNVGFVFSFSFDIKAGNVKSA